jgi:hypothetical protein
MSQTLNVRLEDRLMECLAQAREAERLALDAESGVKEGYLSIARAWKQLAEEIARAIGERGNGGSSR